MIKYLNNRGRIIDLIVFRIASLMDQLVDTVNGTTERMSDTLVDISWVGLREREYSNLIHEVGIAVRGHLSRSYAGTTVVNAIEATELLVSNFATAEQLCVVSPLNLLLKSTIANLFRNWILNTSIPISDWEYSLTNISSFYPRISDNNPFSHSCLPLEIECEDGYLLVPGQLQFVMDPILHWIMMNHLSFMQDPHQVKKLNMDQTLINLAAMLFWQARQDENKDGYALRVPRLVDT